MAHDAWSVPELDPARSQSRPDAREDVGKEDRKVQLLLGSLALGSIALSVLSSGHPFG